MLKKSNDLTNAAATNYFESFLAVIKDLFHAIGYLWTRDRVAITHINS